jgi:acetylornithine deacetylase/succinyl-diaminopimelate desuccinylase-like protein
MTQVLDSTLVDWVRKTAGSQRYADLLRETLVELMEVDTSAHGSIAEMAAREARLFDVIQRRIANADSAAVVQRVPIDPAIEREAEYTIPLYAIGADGKAAPVATIYAGRCNLVVSVGGEEKSSLARASGSDGKSSLACASGSERPFVLHAHVDVVPPWHGPRQEGTRIFGRGACDNKAQAAVLIAQLQLLKELERELGRSVRRDRMYQFVIDEEIGGNGSLSLACDSRFTGGSVLVAETTGLKPFCAHRGCVYYRCRLSTAGVPDVSALEMYPFAVIAMENEGRRIRDESKAPMFLPTHVQTNHGMLGRFGHACGSVCDRVSFEITARARANAERIGMKLIEFLDEASAEYVKLYGDKTRELDAATGKPKVARHFDVKVLPGAEYHTVHIDVYGKGGHMGSLIECDSAITKGAYLLATLMHVGRKFPMVRAWARLREDDAPTGDPRSVPAELWLQGGQGFTPSHRMEDIKTRLAAAARRGVEQYCRMRRVPFDEAMLTMTFDLLHNDAYADAPDCEPMQALHAAFEATGEPWPEPVAWETSCDARIYHHRGVPAAIFGAGPLEAAHGPDEYVDIPEMQKSLAITTLATWVACG